MEINNDESKEDSYESSSIPPQQSNQSSRKRQRNRSLSPQRTLKSVVQGNRSIESSDLTAEKLCTIAITDLYHDFQGNEEAIETAPFSIPTKNGDMCEEQKEDEILRELLGLTRDENNLFVEPADKDNSLLKGYNSKFIATRFFDEEDNKEEEEENEEEEDAEKSDADRYKDKKNHLYEAYKEITKDNDIFLIVDFMNSGFKNALKALKYLQKDKEEGPTLYWVQNRQTLYDPAKKAHPGSKAGEQIFKDNDRVNFCWENTKSVQFLPREIYPSWSQPWSKPIYQKNLANKNELFFSKNQMNLILQPDPDHGYDSQSAVCILKTEDNNFAIMSEEMASKRGVNLKDLEYSDLQTMLDRTLQNIGETSSQNAKKLKKMIMQHHVAAKRLGDQGQALSCLNDGQEFTSKEGSTIALNGLQCFVTHDRVALAAAIAYQVPIVLFLYKGNKYFAMFIKESLFDDTKQTELKVESLQRQIKSTIEEQANMTKQYEEIKIQIEKYEENIKEYDKSLDSFKARIIDKLIEYQIKFNNVKYEDNEEGTEKIYRDFVTDMYTFVVNMRKFQLLYEKSKRPMEEIVSSLKMDTIEFNKNVGKDDIDNIKNELDKFKKNVENIQVQLRQLKDNIVKIQENIYHLHQKLNQYVEFNNDAKVMKQICNGLSPMYEIGNGDKHNINQSMMFQKHNNGSSVGLTGVIQHTLSEYLKQIRDMLESIDSDPSNGINNFYKLLHTILIRARISSEKLAGRRGDSSKFKKNKDHLESIFREIAQNGGKRHTYKRTKGGNSTKERIFNQLSIYQQSIHKEAIIRSAFSILYAGWKGGQRWIDSKKDVWDKHRVMLLYDKLKELDNMNLSTNKDSTDINNEDFSKHGAYCMYYIPFVKNQIDDTKDVILQWMYRALIDNDENTVFQIPSSIENELNAFLSWEKRVDMFFDNSIPNSTPRFNTKNNYLKRTQKRNIRRLLAKATRNVKLQKAPLQRAQITRKKSTKFKPVYTSSNMNSPKLDTNVKGGRRTQKRKHNKLVIKK
jgi:predicted  nucleic acid-binding Zn-ribbon protein